MIAYNFKVLALFQDNWTKLADQHSIETAITFYLKSKIGFKKDDHKHKILEKEAF